MRRFLQTFMVHPVGQGLFYSGLIEAKFDLKEELFRFVYDCGSLKAHAGEEEVDRYRQQHFSAETDRLGLLIISHFDADHINHIKRLLATKRKVDKIVMPFIEFAERLFLVLRYIENKNGVSEDDFGMIRFMLNPIEELGPHLDDDGNTTVFLVTSDPNTPAGGNFIQISENEVLRDDSNMEFGFKGEDEELTPFDVELFFLSQLNVAKNSKIRSVKDSVTADLHFKTSPTTQLMEFVFYRRGASGQEQQFYKAVFDAFCQKYKIETDASDIVDRIVDAVRKIGGATEIRKIYKDAKKLYPEVKITNQNILDMNTTALCMLHRNMDSISKLFGTELEKGDFDFGFRTQHIEKLYGLPVQVYDLHSWCWYRYNYWNYRFYSDVPTAFKLSKIPNVLLTSDTFLKTQGEVDAFLHKYWNYRDKFWLLQVPHHGSKKSSAQQFFSQMPYYIAKFINYGTRHTFEKKYLHPDMEVTSALVAAGHGSNVFAITEHAGFAFSFYMESN